MVLPLGQYSALLVLGDARACVLDVGRIYSLFPSTVSDYFGTRYATSNDALLYTAKGVTSIIGGGVGAMLYERSGSWSAGVYGSALVTLIAAGLAIGLRASRSAKAVIVGSPVSARW